MADRGTAPNFFPRGPPPSPAGFPSNGPSGAGARARGGGHVNQCYSCGGKGCRQCCYRYDSPCCSPWILGGAVLVLIILVISFWASWSLRPVRIVQEPFDDDEARCAITNDDGSAVVVATTTEACQNRLLSVWDAVSIAGNTISICLHGDESPNAIRKCWTSNADRQLYLSPQKVGSNGQYFQLIKQKADINVVNIAIMNDDGFTFSGKCVSSRQGVVGTVVTAIGGADAQYYPIDCPAIGERMKMAEFLLANALFV